MFVSSIIAATLAFVSAVVAAPAPALASAPQAAGEGEPGTFSPDSQISALPQTPTAPPYPVIVGENGYSSATYHGPYTGTPTTTGAANAPATLAASIPALPPNPTATYYNTQGRPINPMPAPYTPAGGLGTNGTLPRYMVESDFDFESIALGLYQEASNPQSSAEMISRVDFYSGSNLIFFTTVLLALPTSNLSLLVLAMKLDLSSSSWLIKKRVTPHS